MKPELFYLTLVAALTGVLAVPYVMDRLIVVGISQAVGYPVDPKPQSPWAQRLIKAHTNAVENLVVFAPLVLVAHAAGISNATTTAACAVYFWSRVAHPIAYALAVPWGRTIAFVVGMVAQLTLAVQILGYAR
jgi:uncharacterized MAPEG superfamily protein